MHIESSLYFNLFRRFLCLIGIGKFLIPFEVDQSVASKLIQGSIAAPIL